MNDIKYSIAARIFYNFPSNVRQTMEFIKPMVNERFAKMEEFGKTWDGAPVRQPIPLETVLVLVKWESRTIS